METEYNAEELSEMERQTGNICAGLKQIEESWWLAREGAGSDKTGLDELEEKLDRILAKMRAVEEEPPEILEHQSQVAPPPPFRSSDK
jgi:hypothetical protein